MRRPCLTALAVVCAALALAPSTSAALTVPAASLCIVPPVLTACPGGDIAYVVTIVDFSLSPLNNATVTLNFSGCPGFRLCTAGPAAPYTFVPPASIQASTDVHGQVVFWVRGGGTCASGIQVSVTPFGVSVPTLLTDGVNHDPVTLASPDQDGDLVVTSLDAAILAAKTASDPTADLNGDGVHNAADEALLAAHTGHVCPSLATPTTHGSWGGLKIIYR